MNKTFKIFFTVYVAAILIGLAFYQPYFIYQKPKAHLSDFAPQLLEELRAAGFNEVKLKTNNVGTGNKNLSLDFLEFTENEDAEPVRVLIVEDRLNDDAYFSFRRQLRTVNIISEITEENRERTKDFVVKLLESSRRYANRDTNIIASGNSARLATEQN